MNSIWIVFLGIACIQDYCRRKISNWLIAGMFLYMGFWRLYDQGVGALGSCLAATALVGLLLYPLFQLAMLGAGDVKLLAVCSGYVGLQQTVWFLFWTFLAAAIVGVLRMMLRRDAKERLFYLGSYVMDAAKSGQWELYFENKQEQRKASICMAGPALLGYLAVWGGFLH